MPKQAALIAVLIMERPMCVECIATKSALSMAETQWYLQEIGKGMDVLIEEGRCRTCGEPRPVFALSRHRIVPEASPRLEKTAVTAKVLKDYGPLCADCISADCGLPVSDVSPAVKQLEAAFAVKQDIGFCPECRRRILVYSLVGPRK